MPPIPRSRHKQDETRLAVRRMRHVLTVLRGLLDEELRPLGVTSAQLMALHKVEAMKGLTGAKLARVCSVTPQTMQALLTRSERNGWVRRGRDPENQRLVLWSVTPAGHEMLSEAETTFERLHERMWKGVPLPTVRELNSLLERCLGNLGET